VLLSGFGGDELVVERGVFLDLAVRLRVVALVSEAWLGPRYSASPPRFLFWEALRGAVPARVRRVLRAFVPRPEPTPPDWLGPRLRRLFPLPVEEEPGLAWTNFTQRTTFLGLTRPGLSLSLELLGLAAARRGVELRFPFLDLKLARFVLALPPERRRPRGLLKRLLRESLRELLPREIAERDRVTTGEAIDADQRTRNVDLVRTVLEDEEPWRSAPFVDREAARNLLREAGAEAWIALWDMATLELWLRRSGT
jgi:asparagine synthase (glutamine-hydrolysing)